MKVEETLGQDDEEFDVDGVLDVAYSDFEIIINDMRNLPVNQDISMVSSDIRPMIYGLPKKADVEYKGGIYSNIDIQQYLMKLK